MKKKYLQLCPWPFKNGKTFDIAQFDDFKIKERYMGSGARNAGKSSTTT